MKNLIYYLHNMMLAYVAFMLCRIVYLAENWSAFQGFIEHNDLGLLMRGSLLFDTSALLYLNALYLLLMLLPLHQKENLTYHRVTRWAFVLLNGIGVVANLADAVYYPYTGRRTTATLFSEFSNEGNLGSIVGTEVLHHWYLVLAAGVIIYGLWRGYRMPVKPEKEGRLWQRHIRLTPYYIGQTLGLLLMVGLTVGGIRGGFTHAVRPITISNANQYVQRSSEAAIVLNTPFSVIRTLGKKTFKDPGYYSEEELDAIYSPLHQPKADSVAFIPRNIVVLICESLGQEYIDHGYAPFVDSLMQQSLTYELSFANGRKSIDGMPSILSGIPMFIEPFFLTSASLNDIDGVARQLATHKGYETAFFHGAENGSMGFEAFAKASGFGRYYGRTEYNEDQDFGGDKDFDGMWAIWDEPFLQFFGRHITSDLKEPFVASIFTASSHHPFHIPAQYEQQFPEEGGLPMHKCIRYLDLALRRFFEYAQEQPWYENTLFVITGDHTNQSCHEEYQTDLGLYADRVIFFDPTHELFKAERRNGIAQQTDILPTLLGAMHYDQPFVAFGEDLTATPDSLTWAINYNNGIYQYVEGDYLLQFDGLQSQALYDVRQDWMLTKNLIAEKDSVREQMERKTKAVIQSYMSRMNGNKLRL